MMRPCLALLLASLPLAAQPSADLDSKLSGKISAVLQKSGAPSVSVAVVKDGRLVFARAFGFADLAAHRPAAAETRYAVGSISKQFTTAALLLLQEQGKLSLDDKVAQYFPALTRASDITIRQLLSHTSGYEDYAPQDYIIPEWTKPITPLAILDRWAAKPLNFDPGTKWQYSNTNYVLAGAIFEKVAGQALVAFLHQKIFEPLAMTSAADCLPVQPGDAVAYTRYAIGPPRPAAREANGWYFAAGELCMTPSDLARWDMALLQKKILSAHSYEEFTREVRLADGGATHYGLGLTISEFDGSPAFRHGGEVSGFIASNAVYPARNGSVTVLSNQDGMNVVGPLSAQIAALAFLPEAARPKDQDTRQVRAVLEALRGGRIDRRLFTDNANSYFSETALRDCKTSLARLGRIQSVELVSETQRGGMTHRNYRARFARRILALNVYLTSAGKFEQFMVEDQL